MNQTERIAPPEGIDRRSSQSRRLFLSTPMSIAAASLSPPSRRTIARHMARHSRCDGFRVEARAEKAACRMLSVGAWPGAGAQGLEIRDTFNPLPPCCPSIGSSFPVCFHRVSMFESN